mmetsp:Transcript_45984/g.114325  ORF Transcript_45984/g.114325 Transcript_45984/m.114325 type:complete len:100 (+) Transcript_45984:941-1240(+)
MAGARRGARAERARPFVERGTSKKRVRACVEENRSSRLSGINKTAPVSIPLLDKPITIHRPSFIVRPSLAIHITLLIYIHTTNTLTHVSYNKQHIHKTL